jgi:hypothetical protein
MLTTKRLGVYYWFHQQPNQEPHMLHTYEVHSRAFQWGQWSDWTYEGEFFARTSREAQAKARRVVENAGWTRQDGRLEFRAQRVNK